MNFLEGKMKRIGSFVIMFLCTFYTYAQESMYSRPGIGIGLTTSVVQMNQTIKNISRINFSDKSKYQIIELYGEKFYADMKQAPGAIIYYDPDQNIRYIQTNITLSVNELIYGMAVVGYIYREFDEYYFFPNVISVSGFDLSIGIFKNGIILYEIDYDE
jgi:hypothetical protein